MSALKQALRGAVDTSVMDILRWLRSQYRRAQSRELAAATTAHQQALLTTMRRDISQSCPPFRPSQHWAELISFFDERFRESGIGIPEEQAYNLRFSGFSPGDARLHRYLCWMYRTIIAKRDRLGILDRIQANCREGNGFAYRFDDRLMSLDTLLSIDEFYAIHGLDGRVADQPLIVAELGAGWGRLGAVMRQINPQITYVVLDLPEALLVSQSYLPSLFPDDAVRRYDESRQPFILDRARLASAKMWFLGAHDILRIAPGAIDVVVNIGSFQEMPLEYVAMYLEHFARIAAGGSCFLKQLRDRTAHGLKFDEISGYEMYPFSKSWDQRFVRPSTLSDTFFEAGFKIPSSNDAPTFAHCAEGVK